MALVASLDEGIDHVLGPDLRRTSRSMVFTNHNGVRLHWNEKGKGAPILLVMGHRYSSAMWYAVVPALAAEHRVIWFDNRGTGESGTTAKVTIEELAADAFAVMDAAGVEKAHVYGVSMGGFIVQEMALQRPDRIMSMIIGCSGALTAEKPRSSAFGRSLYHLPMWLLKLLMSLRGGGHGYGSAATLEAVAEDRAMSAADKFSVRGLVAQAEAMAAYSTTAEAIAGLTMPALVLHGDEDRVVPFAYGEEVAALLPNSRFVRIPGAGHNYIVVDREGANKAVLGFTREVGSGLAA